MRKCWFSATHYAAALFMALAVVLAFGVSYMFVEHFARDETTRYLFLGACLIGAALKVFGPLFVRHATGLLWLILWLFIALAYLWDATNAVGFSAITRGVDVGERKRQAADYKAQAETVARLKADLPAYDPLQSASILQARYDGIVTKMGGCDSRREALKADCQVAANLLIEIATAAAKEALILAYEAEREKLARMPNPVIDPASKAVADAINRLPLVHVHDEALLEFFGLLIFGLIEGGAFVFSWVLYNTPWPEKQPARRRDQEPLDDESDAPPSKGPLPPDRRRRPRGPARGKSGAAVADALERWTAGDNVPAGLTVENGWIGGAQSAMATAVGVSKPTLNDALKELVGAQRVAMRTSARGTWIKVLPAGQHHAAGSA